MRRFYIKSAYKHDRKQANSAAKRFERDKKRGSLSKGENIPDKPVFVPRESIDK